MISLTKAQIDELETILSKRVDVALEGAVTIALRRKSKLEIQICEASDDELRVIRAELREKLGYNTEDWTPPEP